MDKNILLIIIDSVRARNMSVYGYERETTPFLNKISDKYVTRYTNARAPGIWSLPSHASIFTGKHVSEHGLINRNLCLSSGHTIWEDLHNKYNYPTAVFSANVFLTSLPVGLSDCFEVVEGRQHAKQLFSEGMSPLEFHGPWKENYKEFISKILEDENSIKSAINATVEFTSNLIPELLIPSTFNPTQITSETDIERFFSWQDDQDQSWAACLNFVDAHRPYNPNVKHDLWGGEELRELQHQLDDSVWDMVNDRQPWWKREALESLYDGAIHQLDSQIEKIFSNLEERNELDDTFIVITSDHGEGFGEFSCLKPGVRLGGHNYGIDESLLHVPLITKSPKQKNSKTIHNLVTLTDFPKAVRRTLDEQNYLEEFVTDTSVVASSFERDSELSARLSDGLYNKYSGDAHCVYTNTSGNIEKYAVWDDHQAKFNLYDGFLLEKITDDSGKRKVNNKIRELSSNGFIEKHGQEVDEKTEEQLNNLGYL